MTKLQEAAIQTALAVCPEWAQPLLSAAIDELLKPISGEEFDNFVREGQEFRSEVLRLEKSLEHSQELSFSMAQRLRECIEKMIIKPADYEDVVHLDQASLSILFDIAVSALNDPTRQIAFYSIAAGGFDGANEAMQSVLEASENFQALYKGSLSKIGALEAKIKVLEAAVSPKHESLAKARQAKADKKQDGAQRKWSYSFTPELAKHVFTQVVDGTLVEAIYLQNKAFADIPEFLNERENLICEIRKKPRGLERDSKIESLYAKWKEAYENKVA